MQEGNRKNQKHIGNNELILDPNNKLGDVFFGFREGDIITVLGEPDEISRYDYSDTDSATCMSYYNLHITLFVHYENDKFDYLSISVDDLILDGVKLSIFNKDGILKHIQRYHSKHNLDYVQEYNKKDFGDFFEDCYCFPSLGLTIWFEDDEISDIIVQKSDIASI